MRKHPPGLALWPCLLLAVLGGCVNLGEGTREPTRFYSLQPSSSLAGQETGVPRPAPLPQNLAIQIGPVRVPGYLNRSEIVTKNGPNEYRLAEFHRWAEPLDDNIARVLAQDLETLLQTNRISLFPWKQNGQPDLQVVVDIQRLDATLGQEVVLTAKWSLLAPASREVREVREATFREQTAGPGYPDLVAAMGRSLGALSTEIAKAIEAQPAGMEK